MSPIPKSCKRLAEVDFPIAVVSKHAAREKSIRHGHPSTLHLWWARRPLAACRAMLMALLLPDPADPECPEAFVAAARRTLLAHVGAPEGWKQEVKAPEGVRRALLKFIGDFADWDHSADPHYLKTARALVKAAHGNEPPLVVDPFAGGGSIPLEALRVGCDAFASDLNPVACLILKTMLEDIPRHGPGLADELRTVGAKIKKEAERELKAFYPADPDGATPIAYLWARTVRCEAPDCGAEIPLVRSFWLSKKANRRRALRPHVKKTSARKGHTADPPEITFEVFTPKTDRDAPSGTVSRAKATCVACRTVLAPERVRAQLYAQRGGADVIFDLQGQRKGGARLLALVSLHQDKTGRQYRVATEADYRAVWKAQKKLADVAREKLTNGLSVIPDEPTPAGGGSGAGRAFSVQKYGMLQWGDLFTARQKLALASLARLIRRSHKGVPPEVLAIVLDGVLDRNASLATWRAQADQEKVEHVFARQALPITWDFAEAVPISLATGSLSDRLNATSNTIAAVSKFLNSTGQVQLADASSENLPRDSAKLLFTDPPYYDAIPYSDLSDFFFVWLKRALPESIAFRDPFDALNPLTPKSSEAVQDETRSVEGKPKDRVFFEHKMSLAFQSAQRVLTSEGIGCVVFAHKTTEGWEALLSGLIRGGFVITSSWPISTEMKTRLRARESAALDTSVHLVCRTRHNSPPTGEWSGVVRELRRCIGDWMERLAGDGVRGADLVFACIGPAMEVYSRYEKVEDAEGREIPLGGNPEASRPHERGFLAYVWEYVGRAALNQVLGTGQSRPSDTAGAALEEDARLTALFLWTLQATATNGESAGRGEDDVEPEDDAEDDESSKPRKGRKGLTLVYDVVRRFAQPLGIHLDDWEHRIIETEKGVVRLLPVADRSEQLFGERGADVAAGRIESAARRGAQLSLDFVLDQEPAPAPRGRGASNRARGAAIRDEDLAARPSATTLDRVHAAMLLQAAGRASALRTFLAAEVGRGPEFVRLANALSALYPKDSEEKRLLDAMLLAVPR